MAKRFDIRDRFWLFGGAASPPFQMDSGTLWYNFKVAPEHIEPTGAPSIAFVPEQVHGVHNLENVVKAGQPLVDPNGAVFTTGPDLDLTMDVPHSLAGVSEIYVAALIYYDPTGSNNGDIIRYSTSNNPNTTLMRAQMSGLRTQMVIQNPATSADATVSRLSPIVTKGVWSVWEFKLQFGVMVGIWKDGVTQALLTSNPVAGSFAAGTPMKVIVGDYLDGKIMHIIEQIGPQTEEQRLAKSAFLLSEKP